MNTERKAISIPLELSRKLLKEKKSCIRKSVTNDISTTDRKK